jgi:hypothetical protein
MYPNAGQPQSNEYVQDEASFGSYDVNEKTRPVIHHVQGANTGDRLVGKTCPESINSPWTGVLSSGRRGRTNTGPLPGNATEQLTKDM